MILNHFLLDTLEFIRIPLQPSKKECCSLEKRTKTKCCLTEVLIALDHFECSLGDVGKWSCLFVFSKSCIHLFFRFQGVPLGNGAARVGQHVRPVPELCACGIVANKDFSNSFILSQLVIIQNSNYNLHFLERSKKTEMVSKAKLTK